MGRIGYDDSEPALSNPSNESSPSKISEEQATVNEIDGLYEEYQIGGRTGRKPQREEIKEPSKTRLMSPLSIGNAYYQDFDAISRGESVEKRKENEDDIN